MRMITAAMAHTTAPDAPLGTFGSPDGSAKVIADVAAIHDLIAVEHPGLPVIVFGHSMGGLIALNFVLQTFRAGAGRGDLERELFGGCGRPPRAGDPRL